MKTTIILPQDPSTSFLTFIIDNLKNKEIEFDLINVMPNQDSYDSVLEKLKMTGDGDFIIFLGHGSSDRIYGGESEHFAKRYLVKRNEMSIFKNKNLFLLACDSTDLLKSSFNVSNIKKSIGFGPLPTELSELNSNKFKSLGVDENIIDQFKKKIVDVISDSLIFFLKNNHIEMSMLDLKDHILLLINKEINNSILIEQNRPLGDLLFYMKTDMAIY